MDEKKKKFYNTIYYSLTQKIFYKIIKDIIESQDLSNIRKKN